jgi:hypothetical protein
MLYTVAHVMILCLTMRFTYAAPAKDTNGFRLGITMPAFHKNIEIEVPPNPKTSALEPLKRKNLGIYRFAEPFFREAA